VELAGDYFCPVCGIALAQSDFDALERGYYCPHCSTQQTRRSASNSGAYEAQGGSTRARPAPPEAEIVVSARAARTLFTPGMV